MNLIITVVFLVLALVFHELWKLRDRLDAVQNEVNRVECDAKIANKSVLSCWPNSGGYR